MQRADEQQLKAINSTGSAVVISGPGSGKTFSLVEKAKLERSKGNTVLCLTFTRAAAQEIRNRVKSSPKGTHFTACTIHSLAYHHVGFNSDYEAMLTAFIRSGSKPEFDVVLVDEFQDLSPEEMKVVISVSKDRLFFVGDPKQSIFGYAEATGSEIAKVKQLQKFYLTRNYRSGTEVVRQIEKINPVGIKSVIPYGNPKVKGTAILFRTNDQMDEIAWQLKQLGYDFQIRKRGHKYPGEVIGYPPKAKDLVLATIHCSKGTEYERVLVMEWGYRKIERNLWYVAISRASKECKIVDGISEVLENLNG